PLRVVLRPAALLAQGPRHWAATAEEVGFPDALRRDPTRRKPGARQPRTPISDGRGPADPRRRRAAAVGGGDDSNAGCARAAPRRLDRAVVAASARSRSTIVRAHRLPKALRGRHN